MSATASARPIGHHLCPYSDLVIQGAADTLAAARFAKLLANQSEIAGRYFDRGIDKWLAAVESGTESHVIDYASDAIREVEGAKHPHGEAIVTLIGRVVEHTRRVVADRDPRYQMYAGMPFELRGGRTIGAALLETKRM